MNSRAATIPSTATGTFTRNTEPHQKWSSSQPPTMGPSGTPRPMAAAMIEMARARWAGGKITGRIAVAIGVMIAEPSPIRARAAISPPVAVVQAAPTEARPKKPRPTSSTRRRPTRSPSAPIGSSRPAKTRMYASTIHCRPLVPAPRSAARVGSATLRIVPSRPSVSRQITSAPRAHQRREPFMTETTF
jgi:hypothetical protein